jgi:hypothetical protein
VHYPLGLISHDTIQPDTTLDRTPDNEAANESFLPSPQTGTVSGIHEVGRLSYNDQVSAVQFAVSPASYVLPFSLGQAVSRNASPLPEPSKPVTDVECARLVSLYLSETGTWCETTDSERHFTSKSIYQMLDSKPFLASAIALASRQHDAVQDQRRSVTLELYQYTIQLLLRQDPDKAGAPVLATCTLLCVYEMMASCVWEWRRHLKVCIYGSWDITSELTQCLPMSRVAPVCYTIGNGTVHAVVSLSLVFGPLPELVRSRAED